MTYKILDENGELMRIVGRLKEALSVIALRQGWSYVKLPKPKVALPQFEEALF